MAYSITGIVNLAYSRIGVQAIPNIIDNTPQAQDANAIWEYIRDEVLETKDWKFATSRVALAKHETLIPAYTYDYAYPLPASFLRLCNINEDDPPVYPSGYPYSIEMLYPSGGNIDEAVKSLCTNYDNSSDNLFIKFIQIVNNPQLYSPGFVSALAFRLAAELAIKRREGSTQGAYSTMMQLYQVALRRADAINIVSDYEESLDTPWDEIGR